MTQTAILALEDGSLFSGEAFGAPVDVVFELVFNTSMTGYQEILTDPSYRGQGVLFTASHIGNTGINLEDDESLSPQASAVIVREVSQTVSNWRSTCTLPEWLAQSGVPGISGIDVRFLTRKLRDGGTLKAGLSTRGTSGPDLVKMAQDWSGLDGRDMVQEVTCHTNTCFTADPGSHWLDEQPNEAQRELSVVVFDFGAKRNILRYLLSYGLSVIVVPAYTTCAEVVALNPDGVLLSNGPGDPAGLDKIVGEVRKLIETDIPMFGICLGHQLIGRALGGDTIKLKFGHHSGNHPVLDLHTGQVQVTSQNHNYEVSVPSLDPNAVEVTHLSLNDHTLEGMRLKNRPVFSVQYHPEASPGPHDSKNLFYLFYQLILQKSKA